MDPVSLRLQAEPLILQALREDVTSEDVTTASVIGPEAVGRVQLIAKQDGVICGLDVFARTFELLDATTTTELSVAEGDDVREGQVLGSVHAHVRALLSGERVALNYLQRMSGIATMTRSMAALFAGTRTRLWTRARPARTCACSRRRPCAWAGEATTATTCRTACCLRTTT
jgi:nicotinate-nucleotide pyrophosphorylase (carboxylating)